MTDEAMKWEDFRESLFAAEQLALAAGMVQRIIADPDENHIIKQEMVEYDVGQLLLDWGLNEHDFSDIAETIHSIYVCALRVRARRYANDVQHL